MGCGSGSCGCGPAPKVEEPKEMAPDGSTIELTEKAIEKVNHFQSTMSGAQDKLLRIAIRAGGCSGYSYDFVFDAKRDGDFEIAAGNAKVLVDPMSMNLLKGSKIDFMETMQGAGFVVDNPNSSGGCGCGSSFSA